MRYEVKCLTCDKPVERMAKERDPLRRSTIIVVWCHGKYAELNLGDSLLVESGIRDICKLEAFAKPAPIIIDRDRGDEDPNEPWQGETCQM